MTREPSRRRAGKPRRRGRTGKAAGLHPAGRGSSPRCGSALKEEGHGTGTRRREWRPSPGRRFHHASGTAHANRAGRVGQRRSAGGAGARIPPSPPGLVSARPCPHCAPALSPPVLLRPVLSLGCLVPLPASAPLAAESRRSRKMPGRTRSAAGSDDLWFGRQGAKECRCGPAACDRCRRPGERRARCPARTGRPGRSRRPAGQRLLLRHRPRRAALAARPPRPGRPPLLRAAPRAEKMEIAMDRGGRAWRGFFPVGARADLRPAGPEGGHLLRHRAARRPPRVRAGLPLHGPNLFPAQVPELRRGGARLPGRADAASRRRCCAASRSAWAWPRTTSRPATRPTRPCCSGSSTTRRRRPTATTGASASTPTTAC